jgi:hypothetical protein
MITIVTRKMKLSNQQHVWTIHILLCLAIVVSLRGTLLSLTLESPPPNDDNNLTGMNPIGRALREATNQDMNLRIKSLMVDDHFNNVEAEKGLPERATTTTTTASRQTPASKPTQTTTTATITNSTDPEILNRTAFAAKVARQVSSQHPWFADMDFYSTGYATACGIHKCFYPSISNASIGYLVARGKKFQQMNHAYNLEVALSKEFGTPLLSVDPPMTVEVTDDMVDVLRQYTRQWGYPKQEQIFSTSPNTKSNVIAVQKVWKAKEPSLTVAFTRRKGGSMIQKLPWFVEHIPDPAAFRRRFLKEQRRAVDVVTKYSHLLDDFQFIVDTKGRIYHIDLDRNGDTDPITDPEELREEVEFMYNDMTWLRQQLVPPHELNKSLKLYHQKCQQKFCRKYEKKQNAL